MDFFVDWFMDLSNSKTTGLVIYFVVFVSIIIYIYTGKKRTKRLESYKDIPFLEDDDKLPVEAPHKKSGE